MSTHSERRTISRCPICQGPAVEDSKQPDGVRCRTSICKQNHQQQKCPRCSSDSLENVRFESGEYIYTCSDCLNTWRQNSAAR